MAAPRRDPFGLTEQWTVVDERPVRALSAGGPAGPPEVVLVPGLGAAGYLVPWARHASAWTRATVLDLPGWNGGHAVSCRPTVGDAARTTARWLEATGRHDIVLVGHSTGAQVALLAARPGACTAAGRVIGLGLAGPTFEPVARSWPAAARRAAAAVAHGPVGVAEATLPSYVRSGGLPLLRFVRSALADRPEDHVPDLGVPVLVMTARRDPFCPPSWAARLARSAGTCCHVLDGGHTAQYSAPRAADDLVRLAVRTWTA